MPVQASWLKRRKRCPLLANCAINTCAARTSGNRSVNACLSKFKCTAQAEERASIVSEAQKKGENESEIEKTKRDTIWCQRQLFRFSKCAISYPRNASMPYASALRETISNLLLGNPTSNPTGVFSRGWQPSIPP